MGENKFHRLRLGMVGGGLTGKIGAVHRIAARQHGLFEIVAGALSSNPETAHESAVALGIAADRSYASYEEMAKAEAAREDGIEAVSIVTPNDLHPGPAIAFARAGIDVICDKPLSASYASALEMEAEIAKAKVEFVLTHNYTGYPMVRQARQMVEEGAIGQVRQVRVEYLQDGLLMKKQAKQEWRGKLDRCGPTGTIADIGSHAYHMARYVTGMDAHSVAADFATYSEGRELDDHCELLLRYENGARGSMTCSQTSVGKKCHLVFNVYGDNGSLHWQQERPNELLYCQLGKSQQILQRGMGYLGEYATPSSNIAAGHTEGYYEAFAQIYVEAHALICARRYGTDPGIARKLVPNMQDGLAVSRFMYAAVESSSQDARWVELATINE